MLIEDSSRPLTTVAVQTSPLRVWSAVTVADGRHVVPWTLVESLEQAAGNDGLLRGAAVFGTLPDIALRLQLIESLAGLETRLSATILSLSDDWRVPPDDFRIVEGERQMHILNAPSPAATSSLAIGRVLAGEAVERFGL